MATTETERPGRQSPPPETSPENKALGEPPGVAEAADEEAVKALKPAAEHDATEWFLTTDERVPVYDVPVMVTGPENELVEITWVLRPIDGSLIDKIERRNVKTMPGDEPGEKSLDRAQTNAEIVVEATVKPDLRGDERLRRGPDGEPVTPPAALRKRFENETGVIDQLAGQVRMISGYGPDRIGKSSMRLVRAASG